MMRADVLNSHVYPVRTEMTATKKIPTSHICSLDQSKLKEFLVENNLYHICSTEEDKSKVIIVYECSTEKDESEYVNTKKMQRMRQMMRNYQVQMKCQAILTYSDVVGKL